MCVGVNGELPHYCNTLPKKKLKEAGVYFKLNFKSRPSNAAW